jgi:hypothetical protein
VSYDDGETWQPAPVLRAGQQRQALLQHPADARHVSLRATATDSAGGSAEVTIIRAYRLHRHG